MTNRDCRSLTSMPPCIETKHTLSGETQTYSCELLHYEAGFGTLRYIIDREYDIAGLRLSPGDETIALYWEERPYTLYVWLRKTSPKRVYYFNIADRIALTPQEFIWRDLAVDVLVDDRGARVLDEHELPVDIDPRLARWIQSATILVVNGHQAIIAEADSAVQQYVPPAA